MAKAGRTRDEIWKHVERNEQKNKYFNCLYCNQLLYGQVRTLRGHLANCSKVDEENEQIITAIIQRAHTRQSTQNINKKEKESHCSSILGKRLLEEFEKENDEQKEKENESEPASKKRKMKQPSITEYKSTYYHVMSDTQQKMAMLLLMELRK